MNEQKQQEHRDESENLSPSASDLLLRSHIHLEWTVVQVFCYSNDGSNEMMSERTNGADMCSRNKRYAFSKEDKGMATV
ncbi:hypothetical protein STEG23_002210, partial [Scotinomys teguina]